MNYEVTNKSDFLREIAITLNPEDIATDMQKEVAQRTKKIEIKGFRKGKAPASVIKKMFGDALEHEAAEKIANNKFWDIIKEAGINPLSEPVMTKFDFEVSGPLAYTVQFEVIPQLEPKDYTGLTIEVPEYIVTDEDVEAEVSQILMNNAKFEESEVVADKNTIIHIDLVGLDADGNQLADQKRENMKVNLAEQGLRPEVLQAALNKKAGEEFTFPADHSHHHHHEGEEHHHHELEVKTYHAVVKKIEKIILPELDDAFVKNLTKERVTTVEDLKANIKKDIENYFEKNTNDLIESKLLSEIVKNNEFTPPTILLERMKKNYLEEELKKSRLPKFTSEQENQILTQAEPMLIQSLKWQLLREEIIKKESIEVTRELIEKQAKEHADKVGIPVETLIKYYEGEEFKGTMLNTQAMEFLKSNNTINKINPKSEANAEAEKKDAE